MMNDGTSPSGKPIYSQRGRGHFRRSDLRYPRF
jgi:hypothetical protein